MARDKISAVHFLNSTHFEVVLCGQVNANGQTGACVQVCWCLAMHVC